MRKNYFALLFAMMCVAGKGSAQTQPCFSDETRARLMATHPEIAKLQEEFNKQVRANINKIHSGSLAKTTNAINRLDSANWWYDVPVVVHLVHDFGAEEPTDDNIFDALTDWNTVYAKQNADTSDVIAPFKPYIGNPQIRLHLATKDPLGRPTKGITRHRHYLTYNGGDDAKFDDWDPTSYVNIWIINTMSAANSNAAAYAYFPSTGASLPFYDGIICLYTYYNTDKTINHEMGHVFSLEHPWGSTNNPAVACGDDEVDDTPPTMGHSPSGCVTSALYDTTCARNYFKIYPDTAGHDSLVNYPDTTNAQNIMDYTYCSRMFTKGQVYRMHSAMNSDVAGRNHLWDSTNLQNTGVWDASFQPIGRLDLKPVPAFNVTKVGTSYMDKLGYFTLPNQIITFHNQTWNDTVTTLKWLFTDGAGDTSSSTSTTTFNKTFAHGGWVKIAMTATGNHTGDSTIVDSTSVYVAENNGIDVSNYFQEFDPAGDRAQWPMFNYYNNEFKWTYNDGIGFDDGHCLQYTGFDSRLNPALGQYPVTGSPKGDVDEMYTRPVNLSGRTSCNLDFFISAASRSAVSTDITDTLQIDYSTGSNAWTKLTILSKGSLFNKGSRTTYYTPASQSDWAPVTIALPTAALAPYTTFRFRYRPSVGSDGRYSSGNNVYIDRMYFSALPAGVEEVGAHAAIAVAPNPTTGDAYVLINEGGAGNAQIVVTDIAGKIVYTVSEALNAGSARIKVPHAVLNAQGIYLVQVTTGNNTSTQKLVVY